MPFQQVFYVPVLHCFQEKWVHSMTAAGSFVALGGLRAIKMLHKMEEHGLDIAPGFLRGCFERMVMAEDVMAVISRVEAASSKVTLVWVKAVATEVLDKRMWNWCFLSECIGPDLIHPERSVLPWEHCVLN